MLAQDAHFPFHDFPGLLGGLRGLQSGSDVISLSGSHRIELPDSAVTIGKGLFELLDRGAMGGFPVAEFDFQLVDAVLGRLELLDLGTEPIPVGQSLVELRNVLAQDTHFPFQDLPGLHGVSTGLLRLPEFMRLGCKHRLDVAHAPASGGSFSLRDGQLL